MTVSILSVHMYFKIMPHKKSIIYSVFVLINNNDCYQLNFGVHARLISQQTSTWEKSDVTCISVPSMKKAHCSPKLKKWNKVPAENI